MTKPTLLIMLASLMSHSGKGIKKIGFVVKFHQPEAFDLATRLAAFALSRGVQIFFAEESKHIAKAILEAESVAPSQVRVVRKPKLVELADAIVVIGGDGTYLSIARLMRERSIPVLGINTGTLGFLTEFKVTEALDALHQLIMGAPLPISERALLEVTLQREGKVIFQGPVVNDMVISKGAIARIIEVQVKIGESIVSAVRADGLIVSTPTGSTAYSLAAGGPIVEPSLNALILTPICPFSLTHRPLVVSDQIPVELKLSQRPGSVLLTLDGQDAVELKQDDIVSVRRYQKHTLKLISSPDRDYFGLLREKLQFGQRFEGK